MHSVMAGSWFFGRLPWKKYLLSSLPSPPLTTALQRARMLRESSKTAGLSLCLPLLAELPHSAWLRGHCSLEYPQLYTSENPFPLQKERNTPAKGHKKGGIHMIIGPQRKEYT